MDSNEPSVTMTSVIDDLKLLPLEIFNSGREMLLNIKKSEEINLIIKSIEQKTMSEILSETNVDGKKKFPNAEMRDQELFLRLKNNNDYLVHKQNHDELKDKIAEEKLNLEFKNNLFKAALMLSWMVE